MALTTNKRNKILAEWKAGKYENPSQVAKAHGISYKTAKKIVNEIPQANAHITDALEIVEAAKRSIKNPIEIKAIERVVEERISVADMDREIIDNNRKLALIVQKRIFERKDDIELHHVKAISGTIKDLESVANPQKTDTTVNVQTNTHVELTEEVVRRVIEQFDNDY